MHQYLDLLRDIIDNGYDKKQDRTGFGRRSVNGRMIHFDVSNKRLPLVTTRKLYPKSIIGETLWFIKGSHCTEELRQLGVKFWDRWAVTEEHIEQFINEYMDDDSHIDIVRSIWKDEYLNSIGHIYGPNWRNAPISNESYVILNRNFSNIPSDKLKEYLEEYKEQNTINGVFDCKQEEYEEYCLSRYHQTIDQLNELVLNLKNNPYSSRLLVNSWVPEFIPDETVSPQHNVLMGRGALAPCHVMFQCFVKPGETDHDKPKLSLMITIRSNDVPVGAPVNIAQYALILHMLAHVSNMEPETLIYSIGDAHIYGSNHREIAEEQIERIPFESPTIWLNPEVKDFFAFTSNDIRIENYNHHDILNYDIHV